MTQHEEIVCDTTSAKYWNTLVKHRIQNYHKNLNRFTKDR